jgi:hypothetical protein
MGAREKLNQAYLNGALAFAAVVGAVTQSWTVFWIAAIIVVASNLHSGGIRLHGRRSK